MSDDNIAILCSDEGAAALVAWTYGEVTNLALGRRADLTPLALLAVRDGGYALASAALGGYRHAGRHIKAMLAWGVVLATCVGGNVLCRRGRRPMLSTLGAARDRP